MSESRLPSPTSRVSLDVESSPESPGPGSPPPGSAPPQSARPESTGPEGGSRPQQATLLQVDNLCVTFTLPEGDLHAVNGVNLTLQRGNTLGIAGESGSGKSVMARTLLGLLPRERVRITGSVRFNGVELTTLSEKELRHYRGGQIAMVFQDPMRSFNPIKTVGAQVAEAILAHEKVSRAAAKSRVIELLSLVRIPNPAERFSSYPHQLSGGMRQRVMIAMALACRPSLVVADEPTTALDVTTQGAIMRLLGDLQEELGMAVIFITHDLNLAATFTHEIAVMYAGKVVERISSGNVLTQLRMPYAKALIDSIPEFDAEPHSRLTAIQGVRPDPLALPPGCAFHPRCPYASEQCRHDTPILTEDSPGHAWACWNPLTESPS
jgi:oligopeptide/dipeptide ABC transporter ATP-binding protein